MPLSYGPKKVSLDRLLLDPNNFRFRDQDRWEKVSDNQLGETSVQRKARGLIEGTSKKGIQDLIGSFRASGWLSVDQIQVHTYEGDRFPNCQ